MVLLDAFSSLDEGVNNKRKGYCDDLWKCVNSLVCICTFRYLLLVIKSNNLYKEPIFFVYSYIDGYFCIYRPNSGFTLKDQNILEIKEPPHSQVTRSVVLII